MLKTTCCGIFLIASSIVCIAAETNAYEKCTSIKSPTERVKCYDTLAKKASQNQTQPSVSKDKKTEPAEPTTRPEQNPDLRRDMQALIRTPMAKGELESTSEYRERVKKMYDMYDKRTYEVVLAVKDDNTDRPKLVSYNPDTEVLAVSMPGLNFGTVGIQIGDKSQPITITRSFLETEPAVIKTSSYTGRNGIGHEVVIEKYVAQFKGLAILGSSNPRMKPQTFSGTVARERVKDILDRGRVVLSVRTELLKSGEDSYLKESWMSKEASVLVNETEYRQPTMKDPRDIERNRLMLPVRLIAMSLLDGNGDEVIRAQGTEQDTTAIKVGY